MNNQILPQKYTIIRAINSSPVPATYLARNLRTGSRVIIKSFSFGLVDSQWHSFNQIENEIKTLKRLNHAQIPKYLDSFQEESSFYLVQEFIKGETLSTQKVYLEEEVIAIAKQVLSILIYLSSQNPPVVHHDLKPENLLIDKDNKIYLIDFGISKEIKGETIGLTTQFGGTEGFIAPEKILGKKSDIRSDLYSLGVTLACLITRTPSSKAVSLLNDDFELIKGALDSYCSKELSNWVQVLVKRKPVDRYSDAAVALSLLEKSTASSSGLVEGKKDLDLAIEYSYFNWLKGRLVVEGDENWFIVGREKFACEGFITKIGQEEAYGQINMPTNGLIYQGRKVSGYVRELRRQYNYQKELDSSLSRFQNYALIKCASELGEKNQKSLRALLNRGEIISSWSNYKLLKIYLNPSLLRTHPVKILITPEKSNKSVWLVPDYMKSAYRALLWCKGYPIKLSEFIVCCRNLQKQSRQRGII
ncbi:MAG: serine/threonine-protein kinase [Xenococcaceae cyanobacterium MO_188.B29]|nr:serine/threonine-protein kinase [Xenococcaceae cyanobacterium MO_188.B29]